MYLKPLIPILDETCHSIDVVEPLVCKEFAKQREDPFETCIALSLTQEIEDLNLKDSVMRLDGEAYIFKNQFEDLWVRKTEPNPSSEKLPQTEQKPSPSKLRYAS